MADTTKKMEKNQTAAVPQTHQFTEDKVQVISLFPLFDGPQQCHFGSAPST